MMLTALLPARVAGAEKLPRSVLIIDGSGSMWGRINGREKIVIAREQLADSIRLLQGKTELGVMSYGHRRRRDCRDIEMIVPIGPVDPRASSELIKRLLPRGKTPVSSALQMAAKALAKSSSGATNPAKGPKNHIVLVADGAENCRIDPCETATRLAAQYPDLAIDVIAFAVPDKDIASLQCISDRARGRFQTANNGPELKTAIASLFTSFGPLKTPQIQQRKQKKQLPPGLYLSAALAKNAPPLKKDIAWRVYKQGESSKTGATPLKRSAGARVHWPLQRGFYHVEARFENLLAEREVELLPGEAVKLKLDFNKGIVTANARLDSTGPLSDDIIFSLYDASSDKAGPGTIIAHRQEKNAVFYLSPGKYSLKARTGETQAQHDFSLKAGEQLKYTLLLNAGRIRLAARLAAGSPLLDDVEYALYQRGDKTDAEFVRTLDPNPELVLPAGDYFLVAKRGSASRYTRLKVRAGERRTVTLDLNAGLLKLSSNLDSGSTAQPDQIAYTIQPAGTVKPKTVKLSLDNRLVEIGQSLPTRSFRNSFVLPAGEYVVHALYGNSNARAIARVDIAAGRESNEKIFISAGRVRLSLVLSDGDQPLPGVFWTILDRTGEQVASASSRSPLLTLATGSYQAVADYLGETVRGAFTVREGKIETVRLRLQ